MGDDDDVSPTPPPETTSAANFTIESEDISSLLHNLLHNSSSQPSTSTSPNPNHHQFTGSALLSDSSALPESTIPFGGPYYYSSALSMEVIDYADCQSEEETRLKSGSGRSSSKRTRAAEVHNLSEKRRRQRINEKMKALQKLIPNSNKTDKASMLDEAIEYLKQLQLQVQMLTMRNSSSTLPFYLPGALQPPSDEANCSKLGSFTADQETFVETTFNLSGKPDLSDYKLLMTKLLENNSSETTFAPEPSTTVRYRPFNASMSSKVCCKDMNHCGQSSSSGVSS